jgi:hypothetical protein
MNTEMHIDALFSDYLETPALADFKEELKSHLDERIAGLVKSGMDESRAFEKATKELGDMSVAADEISRRKKQEVLGEMYMKTRHYIPAWKIALFVLCGATIGFGLIAAAVTWLASGVILAPIGTMLVFVVAPAVVMVFFALTQETATHEAMSRKRALLYTAAAGVFLFGVFTFFLTYFAAGAGLRPAVATLIPFALPSAAFGVFLILTEKDRSKPWVTDRRAEHMKYANEQFGDPARAQRFGLICGALWIAAIAGFIALTVLFGFKFSWLAIVAALIAQMLVMAAFAKSK